MEAIQALGRLATAAYAQVVMVIHQNLAYRWKKNGPSPGTFGIITFPSPISRTKSASEVNLGAGLHGIQRVL